MISYVPSFHAKSGSWLLSCGELQGSKCLLEARRLGVRVSMQRTTKQTVEEAVTAKLIQGIQPAADTTFRQREHPGDSFFKLFFKPSFHESQYGKQVMAELTCWGRWENAAGEPSHVCLCYLRIQPDSGLPHRWPANQACRSLPLSCYAFPPFLFQVCDQKPFLAFVNDSYQDLALSMF